MADKPRILLITGDGKGKTTAAMGLALRSAGHNLRVFILQFAKNDDSTGELAAFERFDNVRFEQCGRGFIPKPESPRYAEHKQAAQKCLAIANREITSGNWDVIVLDEICVAVAHGLINDAEAIEILSAAPADMILCLTGRGATPSLIAASDTVSSIACVKHGMDTGIAAQKGVEF